LTVRFPLEFSLTIEEAKIRERTDEPLSATHGIPEPVFGHRRLPTRKRRLLAGEAMPARPFHPTLRHLAAVTAKLAFRFAPAMRRLVVAARVARAAPRSASFSIISAWAAIKRARSNRQGRNVSQRAVVFVRALIFARAGLAVYRISLFMALLSSRGLSHPAPASSRQERRSAYFNNDRDIARSQSETFQSLNFCNKLLQFVCCRNQAFRIQSL
jgi:hypothetical protein